MVEEIVIGKAAFGQVLAIAAPKIQNPKGASSLQTPQNSLLFQVQMPRSAELCRCMPAGIFWCLIASE
jgi:hypothetical protein